ncbi:DVU_1556 family methyltransferase [Desulfolutivibrio sulfodismutans]|uniref:DVU_1556 family methyltransferase n=1 Tax=Desulfolutivibrio sulfodismutans TaxID=63561 RepID=UPI001FE72A62|nr:class I SAM-dependent methyltransferase [Desulfolutivibrio sulfodismutans]
MTSPCATLAPVAPTAAPLSGPLYRRADFRAVAGDALRPGGLGLTARGLDAAGFAPGDMVADVGCGPGASVEFLRQRGLRALGVEADPGFAAEAAGRVPGRVIVARAGALPLPDGVLDGALCECALSAFADSRAALAELTRVLAQGGRLVVADLYRRDGADGDGRADGACTAGAMTREAFLAELSRAGLAPILFEDHSRLLAELAGRLLFAGCDAADLAPALSGGAGGCACGVGPRRPRPGYFLCVAVKEVS